MDIKKRIKDMIDKQKRIFKGHNKGEAWRKQKRTTDAAVKDAKKKYIEKIVDKLTEKGGNKTP